MEKYFKPSENQDLFNEIFTARNTGLIHLPLAIIDAQQQKMVFLPKNMLIFERVVVTAQ